MALAGAFQAGPAQAQQSQRSPRAIAVVEFAGGLQPPLAKSSAAGKAKGAAKIFPVTLYWQGTYYDASLYDSDPAPLALAGGNVYEVQRAGAPVGLFTINNVDQKNDAWFGLGKLQPAETPNTSAAVNVSAPVSADEERPTLKREEHSASSAGGSSSGGTASGAQGGGSSGSPTGQQPSASASTSSSSSSSPASADSQNTSSRQSGSGGASAQGAAASATGKPGAQQAQGATPASQASYPVSPAGNPAEQNDPNRPTLRRGVAEREPRVSPQREGGAMGRSATTATAHAAQSSFQPGGVKLGPPPRGVLNTAGRKLWVAVSDATPTDERSYDFKWTPREQAKLTHEVEQAALATAQAYEREQKLPIATAWQQTQVRAYDLFSDNDAEMVLTGTQNIAGPRARQVFVTYVTFLDSTGALNPLFSDVTDSKHLDVKGRLQLIDAVDSSGDGRGDLLFERIGDQAAGFELYRVTQTQLWKLFSGAQVPLGL